MTAADRGWADRLLPTGTGRRRAARVGAQVAREARHYASHLRELWGAAADPPRGGSTPSLGPGRGRPWVRDDGRGVQVVRVPLDGPLPDGSPDDLLVFTAATDELAGDLDDVVAAHAWDDPGLVLVTWDDAVRDPEAPRGDTGSDRVRRKPQAWSPDALLGENPWGRSFAIRRAALDAAGGLRHELGHARWWDLLLRLDPDPATVRHVPRVLARLAAPVRPSPTQALAVVGDHLGERADVSWEGTATGGTVRVRWRLGDPAPTATVVIPTRHDRELLTDLFRGLSRTEGITFDAVVVDNGPRSDDNEAWYRGCAAELPFPLTVRWWTEPFNFSAVNNAAAADATGDVVVFCNDDTEALAPDWLAELVGWAVQPGVGLVGTHLLAADGTLQHAGVVLGMSGFADHVFEGLPPDTDTRFGPTRVYRNWLAVTAACVAVRRSVYDELGGMDERFVLCGSDVALGLAAVNAGYRNVCTPFAAVRHAESATRGGSPIPACDFPTSWWPYQRWLRDGDPYYSPALSLRSRTPVERPADEEPPLSTVGHLVGRNLLPGAGGWDEDGYNRWLVHRCNADDAVVDAVRALHAAEAGRFEPASIAWWLPDLESPFYGGVNTALRLADHLARHHGVANSFVVAADENEWWFRSAFAAAFPSLAQAPITFVDSPDLVDRAPVADVHVATLWETAYLVARAPGARRKVALVQDIETVFSPAGTRAALAAESYRLGLYTLANTAHVLDVARRDFGVTGTSFQPGVDPAVFHAEGRRPYDHDGPVTVFVYARPGHDRNCWELASEALAELKARWGTQVRIVTAGSWATEADLGGGITHLGFLDYATTGALYRTCDLGLTLQVSEHPSYLPLELLACGVPVVGFDHPAGDWLLEHEVNSLRCRMTLDGLVGALDRMAGDADLRARLGTAGAAGVAERFGDWDRAFAGVWDFLCDPEAVRDGGR